MRLLDLFCGAGGATRGYQEAGFEVIGVDIKPQPNYCGDGFIWGNALRIAQYLAAGSWPKSKLDKYVPFDAVHASPPCQAFSSLGSRYDRTKHPDYIAKTRGFLQRIGLPYVIENVRGAPLSSPVQLCGSSFGLGVRRHRLFECSFPVMAPPCNHGSQLPKYRVYEHGKWYLGSTVKVYGKGGGKGQEHWNEAMGIDWMTPAEIVEAIPPAYTQHIGTVLLEQLERVA